MINESIKNFIESLAEYHAENVFNPWADTNPDYEIENAVILRRRQLETYLSRRLSAAKLLLIAEACGYQGGHFTGIAMTCERMILGYHKTVTPMMILGKEGTRTTNPRTPLPGRHALKRDLGLMNLFFGIYFLFTLIKKAVFFPTAPPPMKSCPSVWIIPGSFWK